MATRVRTRPLFILPAVLLVPALAVAAWRYHTRPLPFDSARWRSGDAVLRYRMKDSLRAKYDAGRFSTRDAIDAALGPDDDREDDPRKREFRLREPGITGSPWYLFITFDEQGNVERFMINVS